MFSNTRYYSPEEYAALRKEYEPQLMELKNKLKGEYAPYTRKIRAIKGVTPTYNKTLGAWTYMDYSRDPIVGEFKQFTNRPSEHFGVPSPVLRDYLEEYGFKDEPASFFMPENISYYDIKSGKNLQIPKEKPPLLTSSGWMYYQPNLNIHTGQIEEYVTSPKNPHEYYNVPQNVIETYFGTTAPIPTIHPEQQQELAKEQHIQSYMDSGMSREDAIKRVKHEEWREEVERLSEGGKKIIPPEILQQSTFSTYHPEPYSPSVESLSQPVSPEVRTVTNPQSVRYFGRRERREEVPRTSIEPIFSNVTQRAPSYQGIKIVPQNIYNIYERAKNMALSPYALASLTEEKPPQHIPIKRKRDIMAEILGHFSPEQYNPYYYPGEEENEYV